MPSILVLGATSSIARACCEVFASRQYNFFLASRDLVELQRIAGDLSIRFNSKVDYAFFDITAVSTHNIFFKEVMHRIGPIHGVIMAAGLLNDACSRQVIKANFFGPVCIIDLCVEYLASRKSGFIIGMSSVAGERGRKLNYIYAASKAAFTVYLQGLRSYLYPSPIQVLTIKLGLIDTKMTFHKNYPLFLLADPKKISLKIVDALDKKKESVYIPGIWRVIMFIIRLIPERIFKRLGL